MDEVRISDLYLNPIYRFRKIRILGFCINEIENGRYIIDDDSGYIQVLSQKKLKENQILLPCTRFLFPGA